MIQSFNNSVRFSAQQQTPKVKWSDLKLPQLKKYDTVSNGWNGGLSGGNGSESIGVDNTKNSQGYYISDDQPIR